MTRVTAPRISDNGSTVYIVAVHDYESTSYGPVFETRELAEEFAKASGELHEVEEFEVLTDMPKRVTKHYAQASRGEVVTGSIKWWDYDTPGLPQTEDIFWADSEDDAVAGLERMRNA